MSVVGGQPKKHANPSYKPTKHIERTFLISHYCRERPQGASNHTNLDSYLCSFWPSRTAHVYIALSILDFSWLAIFPFLNT